MDMKKKLLKNNKGETITEVLVALLISVLSLTLLAGMISASVSMTDKSRKNITDYYTAENTLELNQVKAEETADVSFDGSDGEVKLSNDSIKVNVYTNGDGKNEILSYSVVTGG
jgi:Tfp pilus assembly protein PilV